MSDFHLWQLEKVNNKKTRKRNPEPMEIEPDSVGRDPNQQKKEEELANLVKRYYSRSRSILRIVNSGARSRSRIITKILKIAVTSSSSQMDAAKQSASINTALLALVSSPQNFIQIIARSNANIPILTGRILTLYTGARKYQIQNPNERAVAALQLAAKHSSQPEFLCTPLSAPQGNYFLLNYVHSKILQLFSDLN